MTAVPVGADVSSAAMSLPPAFDPTFGKREEFARLTRSSGQRSNEQFDAQMDGATNLLLRAMKHLATGDEAKAEPFIRRVAAMPWDELQEDSPGIRAATVLVYDEVSDELEESTSEDTVWLDVALQVLAEVDGYGKADLASVLHSFVLQGDFFDLSRSETRRIKQAVGGAPLEADLGDGPGASAEHRRVVIDSLVRTALALMDAYGAVYDEELSTPQ